VDDVRPIKIQVGVIPSADGSCYLEWGYNKVLVAVHGPKEMLPKHMANPYTSTIRYNYRMATFSVFDRKNPRPARREIEISKVSAEALSRACFLERFPNTAIDVGVEILDSNAGTRVAALTAASCALADAGIPMRDLVTAISVGIAGGHVVVDLTKEEEDAPDAVDVAMAVLPNSEEIVLMQMDGVISKKNWSEATKKGIQASKKVYELQKQALKEKYADNEGELE
ncbi:MAG: exosome complex exonuclease Rrp41, partial [Candidatus Diapherotrites archaeon]|nr:exosome complex exonuclease Rrp41 [Candidatus Diapherotrites archaeon]